MTFVFQPLVERFEFHLKLNTKYIGEKKKKTKIVLMPPLSTIQHIWVVECVSCWIEARTVEKTIHQMKIDAKNTMTTTSNVSKNIFISSTVEEDRDKLAAHFSLTQRSSARRFKWKSKRVEINYIPMVFYTDEKYHRRGRRVVIAVIVDCTNNMPCNVTRQINLIDLEPRHKNYLKSDEMLKP